MRIFVATITFLVIGLVVTATSYAQAVNPAKIKFKGIGLGSSYAQVVKALGKPVNEDPPKAEECIGGMEKSVQYDGIMFYFMDGDSKDGKTFEVKSFELSAPGILVSGVKIGDSTAVVRSKFGRKYTVDKDPDTGATIWLYAMNDSDGPGTTRVVFRDGKVVMIASDYLVC